MIPQPLLIVSIFTVLRKHSVHDGDNGLGTSLTLFTIFYPHAQVNHALNLTPILGQNELFALRIII